jgi:hypothetical protein
MTTKIECDCTIEHDGKTFEAGGAVITDDYLCAYPGKGGALNDWHGRKIGTYRVISSKRMTFGRLSHWGEMYYWMRATVNGREYSLRGFGVGMVAKGRAIKSAK